MGSATIVTLALVAVLVTVLAMYMLAIGFALRKLSFTLGTIVIGLRAIAQQTGPVGPVVGDLIGDVDVIEDALDGLVGAVVAAKKAPRQAPPPALAAARPSGTRSPQAVAWQSEAGEPATVTGNGDDPDATLVDDVVDYEPSLRTGAAGRADARGRRSQARSSGRGPRSKGSMGNAVARAREKVGSRSRP